MITGDKASPKFGFPESLHQTKGTASSLTRFVNSVEGPVCRGRDLDLTAIGDDSAWTILRLK